jgi:hypothetical protein
MFWSLGETYDNMLVLLNSFVEAYKLGIQINKILLKEIPLIKVSILYMDIKKFETLGTQCYAPDSQRLGQEPNP